MRSTQKAWDALNQNRNFRRTKIYEQRYLQMFLAGICNEDGQSFVVNIRLSTSNGSVWQWVYCFYLPYEYTDIYK